MDSEIRINIEELLRINSLTKRELANHLGISETNINRKLNNRISLDYLSKIANFIGCNISDLINNQNKKIEYFNEESKDELLSAKEDQSEYSKKKSIIRETEIDMKEESSDNIKKERDVLLESLRDLSKALLGRNDIDIINARAYADSSESVKKLLNHLGIGIDDVDSSRIVESKKRASKDVS